MKLRNMTSIYILREDCLLLLYRVGSRVVEPPGAASAATSSRRSSTGPIFVSYASWKRKPASRRRISRPQSCVTLPCA